MIEENKKYFSNSKEELEFYKNTCKSNAEELSTCKSKIKVLENINHKLKEKITQAFSNSNETNDSSKVVFTPNEFKKLWESIIQTELIDSFDFCIKEYKLISNLCQDIMLLIYEETKKIIELKFLDILKCLNLSKTSKEKKDSLYTKMLPFFRENFNNIFEFDEERIKNTKNKLKNIIIQYNFLKEIKMFTSSSSNNLNEVYINQNENNNISNRNSCINNNISMKANNSDIYKLLENKIKGKNFEGIMKSFFNICLYMILHEPVLNFDIEKYSQRKLIYYFFNKKDFINVEGFGNERTPCVIILQPPLLKKKFPFNGLRPAVYILSDININSEILKQCKINEKKKEEEDKIKGKNNEEINEKKIIKNSNSNKNDNRIKKNVKYFEENQNINNNESQKYSKKNSCINDSNKNEYINNNNDINKNNYIRIPNKPLKTNKENSRGNSNEKNTNYKLVNRNLNDNKNKIKNNYQNKHSNNVINKNNYILDNNNPKISHQNLSYGFIQNQKNNLKSKNKINFKKTNSNEKNNMIKKKKKKKKKRKKKI